MSSFIEVLRLNICLMLVHYGLRFIVHSHRTATQRCFQQKGLGTRIELNMAEEIDTEKQSNLASAHRTETSFPTSNRPEMPRPTRGYAQLAEFMTKTRHGMMRRFKDLSTQNLLYLQAEIYQLRFELDRETAADAQCQRTDERSNWDFHWRLLATSGQRQGVDDKRWRIWLNLRERLYEYREQSTFARPNK